MKIHGKEYEEVKDRITRFWHQYPNGSIQTQIESEKDGVIIRAFLYAERTEPVSIIATGLAHEFRSENSREVNYKCWVENCETSAIGRALANAGFSSGTERPSAEEMRKVDRPDPILSGSELIKTYLAMLVGYEEPASTYLRGKGWITEEQTFEDLPVEHIKTCVQHKERFLKALQEVGPNPWDEKGE